MSTHACVCMYLLEYTWVCGMCMMSVYLCKYTFMCMSINCMYLSIYACVYACVSIKSHTYIRVCIYGNTLIYVLCTCICTHVCTCVCMHMNMCMSSFNNSNEN